MDTHTVLRRLVNNRKHLILRFPFFGRLLSKLSFGFAPCETAFTDMRRIVFDPDFAVRLFDKTASEDDPFDKELSFVLLHEVMHCALKHCVRGRDLRPLYYNVACDIVVNSMILDMYHLTDMTVDGQSVMHLAPNGKEGCLYTAEQVYDMLIKTPLEKLMQQYGGGVDQHGIWDMIDAQRMGDCWDRHLASEAKGAAANGSGIPSLLRRQLKALSHHPTTNWRQLLHDYLQHDSHDYLFQPPDRRFDGDLILPSFCENVDGAAFRDVWFFVDTSGSVSADAIMVAFAEIVAAIDQVGSLEGHLAFFDTKVSEPVSFDSVESLLDIKPIGGGGTSFEAVFNAVPSFTAEREEPRVIIIITDGYAPYPEEAAARGVPVLWLIVDSDVEPPWGTCIHIEMRLTEGEKSV